MEYGFGIPRAEGEGLQAGKVGFFEQALEFGVGPGPIFGRALRTEAPEVNAGDGAAKFGEGFLGVDVVDEFAVAGEAVEVVADVGLLYPAGDLLDGCVVVNNVAGESAGVLLPEFVIALEDVVGDRGEGLAIDFHDDAVGCEMGIHPFEGHAFFDEEFVIWIFVEDDFRNEAVDGHDGGLAGDLDAIVNDANIFAGPELVELSAALDVEGVFLHGACLIVERGSVNLAVGIEAAGTFGNVFRISSFQEEAIETDARVALWILAEETG